MRSTKFSTIAEIFVVGSDVEGSDEGRNERFRLVIDCPSRWEPDTVRRKGICVITILRRREIEGRGFGEICRARLKGRVGSTRRRSRAG